MMSRGTGQLLRHYSPDLEVFRILGAVLGSTASGRIVGSEEVADLLDMARWVIDRGSPVVGARLSVTTIVILPMQVTILIDT